MRASDLPVLTFVPVTPQIMGQFDLDANPAQIAVYFKGNKLSDGSKTLQDYK